MDRSGFYFGRVLAVRLVLGVVFAFLLTRFFFPGSGFGKVVIIAALLVFFAYLLEFLRRRGNP